MNHPKKYFNFTKGQSFEQRANVGSRIILYFDFDSFELQLYLHKKHPQLVNQNLPIVLINSDQVILAVNSTAKLCGVERPRFFNNRRALMEAQRLCPHLIVLQTEQKYGKTDFFFPQTESNKILKIIQQFEKTARGKWTINRASKDEFIIDATGEVNERSKSRSFSKDQLVYFIARKSHPNPGHTDQPTVVMEDKEGPMFGLQLMRKWTDSWVSSSDPIDLDKAGLVYGAILAMEIVDQIFTLTNYHVSCGVAHNQLQAKLASSINKPEGLVIMTRAGFQRLATTTFVLTNLPGFGGQKGCQLVNYFEQNNNNYWGRPKNLSDLQKIPQNDLVGICGFLGFDKWENVAEDIFQKCRGHDETPVVPKVHSDKVNTSISFKDVTSPDQVFAKIWNLSQDIKTRMDHNRQTFGRVATLLTCRIELRGGHHQTFAMTLKVEGEGPSCGEIENRILNEIRGQINFFRRYGYCPIFRITLTAKNIFSDTQ